MLELYLLRQNPNGFWLIFDGFPLPPKSTFSKYENSFKKRKYFGYWIKTQEVQSFGQTYPHRHSQIDNSTKIEI